MPERSKKMMKRVDELAVKYEEPQKGIELFAEKTCKQCNKKFKTNKETALFSLPDHVYGLGKGIVAPIVGRGYYCSSKCFLAAMRNVQEFEKAIGR